MKILPIIMCGGSGTRLWPLSRESLPKQFLSLKGENSLFQDALRVVADQARFEPPLVLTHYDYRFLAREQMADVGCVGDIILELIRRDSGPAIAAATEIAHRRAPNTIVATLAADHVIQDKDRFADFLVEAAEAARQGYITTLGVKPTNPNPSYGYIRPSLERVGGAYKVDAFVEKPTSERAATYLDQGYLWNSGNFVFQAEVMLSEIRRLTPGMADASFEAVQKASEDLNFTILDGEIYALAPRISIDVAIMEQTDKAAVIPVDAGWSDVGSWPAVRDVLPQDQQGNAIVGEGVVVDGQNVLVHSSGRLTTVVGLQDIIVVSTTDAVLVCAAGEAGQVKDLVELLNGMGRSEARNHKRVYRPWGYYQTVDGGERYQVKRIVVKPSARLSLQKHHHRAEHWIIVRGTAEVTRNDETLLVHENQSVYLPIGCHHRLHNPGKIDLELIEVQTGSYLEEDDIVRLDDVYNRP